MLKKQLLVLAALCWASSSYSESITPYYGQTGNAAASGNTWDMDSVFPLGVPGLEVDIVIYNYRILKELEDSVNVHVQNENATGEGYIFRETDEWKPGSLSGTEINKAVPVIPGIPRQAWGTGSIEVEGNGSVEDANVIYNYRVDPCYDPQSNPNCPGYQVVVPDIPEVDLASLYDVTDDENVSIDRKIDDELIDSEEENKKSEEELAEEEAEEEKDRKERLEAALAEANNSALFAEALAAAQILESINAATNMNSYYAQSIPGGAYQDTITLPDRDIPENRRGLRNGLAQQLLHEKMIEMQYSR